MNEAPTTITVLSRALELIKQRGWTVSWSQGGNSALNIRSAIAAACTDLLGQAPSKQWYAGYLGARIALDSHLNDGITDWEFKVKVPSEVEAMLAEVIQRLENDEIRTDAHLGGRSTDRGGPSLGLT